MRHIIHCQTRLNGLHESLGNFIDTTHKEVSNFRLLAVSIAISNVRTSEANCGERLEYHGKGSELCILRGSREFRDTKQITREIRK